jgi:hypothetical protein
MPRSARHRARIAAVAGVWALLVTLIVSVASPIVRLVHASTRVTCCCPDPTTCHCPDHEEGEGDGQDRIKACHGTSDPLTSSVFPDVVTPSRLALTIEAPPARAIRFSHASPHAPPELERPRGPT